MNHLAVMLNMVVPSNNSTKAGAGKKKKIYIIKTKFSKIRGHAAMHTAVNAQ